MGVQTVERALFILKQIANTPMRVQDVAEMLDIHQSNASRLLQTLYKENFIRLNSEKKYELGYAIFDLAHLINERLDIRSVARPYIEELSDLTNETIHLAILDGVDVVYLDKIDSKRSVRMYSRVGRRAPAYCTGVGKALLAFSPKQSIDWSKIKLTRITENTITDLDKLKLELQNIRKTGISWDREEHEYEIYCVAAPILDFNSYAIASISISVTLKYTKTKMLASYENYLARTALSISRKMGYNFKSGDTLWKTIEQN